MFKKKKCKKCNETIKGNFDFCPSCGTRLNTNSEKQDWGMLGKNDIVQENPFDAMGTSLLGNAGFGALNKMLGSAMKMLEKEMQKEMKKPQQDKMSFQGPKSNVEMYINGKKVDPKNIKVNQMPGKIRMPDKNGKYPEQKAVHEIELPEFTKVQKEKFQKLKRHEPETNVRRLSDRIIYEINLPGVKSQENISMKKPGKSIEIRAIAKTKAYFKVIQVSLPIIEYYLEKEKLILELETKE